MNDWTPLNNIGIAVTERAELKHYTTFQLGGPCRALLDCATPEHLLAAVEHLAARKTPFILIGGGSNLVVSDQGLDCVVLRYVSPSPLVEFSEGLCRVSGSTFLDDLAGLLARKGLAGLNFASGIPGTVGGAVAGNAGAFGQQIGDTVESADLIDPDGAKRAAGGGDLDFRYRHSALKDQPAIVSGVTIRVIPADQRRLRAERREILATRRRKHPDWKTEPCAGSFFRNLEAAPETGRRQAAGWFLENAGAKDLRRGGAFVCPKHANIITTASGATANDVYLLSEDMREIVKSRYGLDLHREVRLAGPFPGRKAPAKSADYFW
jgi:UDP-N-acetylmuramate dehydrogenase